MALLGHSAWLRISCSDMATSCLAWQGIGFSVVDDASPSIRMTDGQIAVELVQGSPQQPTLIYGNAATTRTAQQCKDRGAPSTVVDGVVTFDRIGELTVQAVPMPVGSVERPDGDQNPVLGFVDDIIVHVDDLDAARRRCEAMGLLVLDQTLGEYPAINVTDGMMTVSLRTMPVAGLPIEYSADIDREVVDDLRLIPAVHCHAIDDADGEPMLIRLTMPEGTVILVGRDD